MRTSRRKRGSAACGWGARIALAALMLAICATGCGAMNRAARAEASAAQVEREQAQTGESGMPNTNETELEAAMKMNVRIGERSFAATLEDNDAVRELIEMMREAPVSIDMSDYSGFEKVGSLGRSLPADDRQTTTAPGDIVLYNGDNIVLFYGPNSWSYTRIGHIDDLTGWEEALGAGGITAIFSIAE